MRSADSLSAQKDSTQDQFSTINAWDTNPIEEGTSVAIQLTAFAGVETTVHGAQAHSGA